MKRYVNRNNLIYSSITCFLLLLSPYIALPSILFGLTKKIRFALVLLTCFFALISYQIIPSSTSDLAQHYTFYERLMEISFHEFPKTIEGEPDFLFYFIMLMYAKIGLSPQWFAATVVFITVNNFFIVYHSFFKKYSWQEYSFGLIILLLSIQWSLLFSGLRNYLAFSFVIVALYNGIMLKKRFSFFWLILASIIHYSSLVFIPIYWLVISTKKNNHTCKNIFVGSLALTFLSKDILLHFTQAFPLPESIAFKISWYLGKDDIIQQAIKKDFASWLSFFIQFLWVYYAYFYLIFTLQRKSILRNIIYSLFFVLNLFFVAPDPFNRFGYVTRFFFLLLLIYEANIYQKKLSLYVFAILMLMYAFVDFYITKNVYFWSLFNVNSLTTVGALIKDYFIQPVSPIKQ